MGERHTSSERASERERERKSQIERWCGEVATPSCAAYACSFRGTSLIRHNIPPWGFHGAPGLVLL